VFDRRRVFPLFTLWLVSALKGASPLQRPRNNDCKTLIVSNRLTRNVRG
jgi:hypothetical protein